jgi:hypothetical protein
VLARVDAERLGDAVGDRFVGIVPAGGELGERDFIRGVAVDLVREPRASKWVATSLPMRLRPEEPVTRRLCITQFSASARNG